jgi:phosphopantothenoylcysteine decarboxylase/phosphopantothenate--cysteine ligase
MIVLFCRHQFYYKTNMNCLISAGPTREWIDPVRFISNPSSGKMGYALAQVAYNLGMHVTLVSGPVSIDPPSGIKPIYVETALEMKNAMLMHSKTANLVIMSAAVSDHRPKSSNQQKIPKDKLPESLPLTRNPDILKILGSGKPKDQTLVGFAAETHGLINSAQRKLTEKNLDWIVVNDVSIKKIGFSSDQNEVFLLGHNQQKVRFSLAPKTIIAKKILNVVCSSWLEKAH